MKRGSRRYEFTGTKLEQFPLPARFAVGVWAGAGCGWRSELGGVRAVSRLCQAHPDPRASWTTARVEHEQIRGQMIALQEELDWEVYRLYGLF